MVFSSTLFLFLFLPAVVAVHTVLPRRLRNAWLLLASLFFYAWGGVGYIIILFVITALDYAAGLILPRLEEKRALGAKKAFLAAVVVCNIGTLAFFKLADLLLGTANALFSADLPILGLALPIGISFYTFQALSYVIDVYRGKVAPGRNIIDFFTFVTLFPQLIAGPIVRYTDIERELADRRVTSSAFASGVSRFAIGLGKKVLLANTMGEIFRSASSGELTMLLAWCASLAYMFQIYFDFSGYSDMAIGLGRMLGFRFPENFRYPYEADSITDFWRRWHITLSSWFREYLYIPLGGNRRGLLRQILNLLIVWACTGLWHGGAWNFLFWGLYFFVVLVLEKLFLLRVLEKLPMLVRRIYSLLLVFFSWVLFAWDDTGKLFSMIRALFGVGVPLSSDKSVFVLLGAASLFIICAVFSTHIPASIWRWGERKLGGESAHVICRAAVAFSIIFLSTAFLVGGSYNPFLYFRF